MPRALAAARATRDADRRLALHAVRGLGEAEIIVPADRCAQIGAGTDASRRWRA